MEDALQLVAAIVELELIGKSSRIMSTFFSVKIVFRILTVMMAYFVTVLKLVLLESADLVMQKLVTMDSPAQLTPVVWLVMRASIKPSVLELALNQQGCVHVPALKNELRSISLQTTILVKQLGRLLINVDLLGSFCPVDRIVIRTRCSQMISAPMKESMTSQSM